jgi:ribonucleoside-diphosphate reductase alpha chain
LTDKSDAQITLLDNEYKATPSDTKEEVKSVGVDQSVDDVVNNQELKVSVASIKTNDSTAPLCYNCGNQTQRAGNCFVCSSCGSTTGCS